MASRLLTRLDAAIAAASTPTKADCFRAERAGLLARLGQLGESRTALSSLQMQYASTGHPIVSTWLCMAEGLLSYYSDMAPFAYDRMRRAHALSRGARDTPLQALCAAWVGFMAYERHDFQAMATYAAEALELAPPEHHAARARACIVLAQAYHFGDRADLAQPWYTQARFHGLAEGDEATLSALIHNHAWLNANLARQRTLGAPEERQLVRQAMMGQESAGNMDALIGSAPLDALVPILRAQILCLLDRHAESLALYEAHLPKALGQGLGRIEGAFRADMSWCHLKLGRMDRARQEARLAEVAIEAGCDADDRAAALSRLAHVYEQLGEPELASSHAERAAADWLGHARDQASAVAFCDKALKIERA